jgi:hypothetical protein
MNCLRIYEGLLLFPSKGRSYLYFNTWFVSVVKNHGNSKFTRASELNIYTALVALTALRNNVYSKDFRRFCPQ